MYFQTFSEICYATDNIPEQFMYQLYSCKLWQFIQNNLH